MIVTPTLLRSHELENEIFRLARMEAPLREAAESYECRIEIAKREINELEGRLPEAFVKRRSAIMPIVTQPKVNFFAMETVFQAQ